MVYMVNLCGYGSFGDDCYVESLRTRLGEVWQESGIAVNRIDPVGFLPDKQEAVVLGGSGLLFHYVWESGASNLHHYLRYPAVMQVFGKPTFAIGMGVQGRLQPGDLEPYVEIINAMKLRTVRDPQSAQILRDAGVSAPVILSADLSYLMELPERLQREPGEKPVLGIAVSQPFKGILHEEYAGFESRVLAALSDLAREFDIHFYSFDLRNEGAIADEWTGPYSRSFYDPGGPGAVERFLGAICESDIFLTSRLHGVIVSARMGIPFVSIGAPGEKIEREAASLESPFNLYYSAESNEIVTAVRDAWSDRKQASSRLALAVSRQEARAQVSIEALRACN